jgi:integrase
MRLGMGPRSAPAALAFAPAAKIGLVHLDLAADNLISLLLETIKGGSSSKFVFPQPGDTDEPLRNINNAWMRIRKAAKIEDVRLHDLRHSYASILASAGVSLPIIGQLLGHTQVETTQRYGHLQDDALREATEPVGEIIDSTTQDPAEVISLRPRN